MDASLQNEMIKSPRTDLPRALERRLKGPLPGHAAWRRFAPELSYGRHAGPPAADARHAGVLVLLHLCEGQWRIPLALRPANMKTHASQVALPGGLCELGEASREAALREAHEELGVPAESVQVLGSLTPLYVFASNVWVNPWVGWADQSPCYVPNPAEVDELFELPLEDLLNPASRRRRVLLRGSLAFTAPGVEFGRHFIWGATSMILGELARVLEEAHSL